MKRLWTWGLGAGAAAAAADATLILTVDAGVSRWVLLEALLFWTVTGWAAVATESGLGRYAHGVAVTVLLNLPWYVLLGPAAGELGHVPPLVVMSAVFGLCFGWARGRARRSSG